MDDLFFRQIKLLREFINDYRENKISLNSLILKIEGIYDLIDSENLRESIFNIILEMEQINVFLQSSQSTMTVKNQKDINILLIELEKAIEKN